jgi:hypothetical protein
MILSATNEGARSAARRPWARRRSSSGVAHALVAMPLARSTISALREEPFHLGRRDPERPLPPRTCPLQRLLAAAGRLAAGRGHPWLHAPAPMCGSRRAPAVTLVGGKGEAPR